MNVWIIVAIVVVIALLAVGGGIGGYMYYQQNNAPYRYIVSVTPGSSVTLAAITSSFTSVNNAIATATSTAAAQYLVVVGSANAAGVAGFVVSGNAMSVKLDNTSGAIAGTTVSVSDTWSVLPAAVTTVTANQVYTYNLS